MRTHSVSIVLTTLLLVAGLTIAPFAALGSAPAAVSAQSDSNFSVDSEDTAVVDADGSIAGGAANALEPTTFPGDTFDDSYEGDNGAVKVNGEVPGEELTITAQADQSQDLVRFLIEGEIATINSVTTQDGVSVPTQNNDTAVEAISDPGQIVDLTVDGANYTITSTDTPTEVAAGDELTVGYEVENTGPNDLGAPQDISFEVTNETGATVATAIEPDVNLASGEVFQGSFNYTPTAGDVPQLEATVASENDAASATVDVLGPANFNVSIDDAASTTDVIAGENAVITATIENTGGQTGTQTIDFTVNDTSVDSTEVTDLAGGATETVEFTYATELADDGATAEVASDNDTATRTLSVGEPANFTVSIDDAASTTSVTAGEDAVINATIENTGDETATQTIDFSVNDTVENSTSVTLDGGATETVEFTYNTELADDGATARVASDNDTASRTLSVAPAPANFDVTINDAASTTGVIADEDAVITATVENTGDETATQTINFTVNDTVENSTSVTLDGGATETVEFTYNTELADDGATARVASDNDTASRTLSVGAPANFDVTITDDASTTSVTAGEDAVINATIENTGDETATQTINFTVNGTNEDSVSVTLAGGATETVEFTYTTELADDGATAAVASNDDSASRTLSVAPTPPNFTVSINNAASTTDVIAGEDAVITATIENTGDEAGTQTINFTVNGTTEDNVSVTLPGGATDTVEFSYTTELADDGATAEVASDNATDSTELTVGEQANFSVSITDATSTTDVIAGEDAVINATIENTGDETATQTINFTVNDTVEDNVSVELGGGATETVEFTYNTELADDGATAAVASDDDSDRTQLTVGAPANFDVTITDAASTTDVTAGEDAVVNATVENTGDETATQTINFTVNGSDEGSVEVTNLAGGATETVEFTYTTELADDGAAAAVASNDDSANRTLSVAPTPANFTVSINDAASTTDVIADEDAVINATIENTGDEAGTQTINFTVNGTTEDNVSVNLAGGATETVEFTYTTDLADDGATATVASDNDTDRTELTVGAPANFDVTITDATSTTDVTAGEDAVINATIENTGDEAATQTINFTVNNTVEDSTSVTLDGGATETVEFTYTTELADDGAAAAVASNDDSANRTLSVAPTPPNFTVSINNAASITDVIAGEDAVINATIENTGDETGTQTINFTVNGTTEDNVSVNLAGGATETVEFSYTTELADDGATAEVASDNATDSTELTVGEQANFAVAINDQASTTDVTAGEDAVITATIENTGDETATQTINFTVNGTTEDSVEVTDLAGGATETVEFTYVTELADDGATAAVASDDDTATRTLTVTEPANFAVSINDGASTTDVTAGENAVINATIENTGDEAATQTIEFTVGGASQDSASVNLAGGATETVEFTYTTEAADDGATAEVASDDDNATRTLTVTEPANFAVAINDAASTTDVTAGEDAVINATIENTGDETATQTIEFTVGGASQDSIEVTDLAGGATETVEFTYTTEAADDGATAEVASDDDSATRTLSVTEPANFAVTINDAASTTDVTAGEDVVINATIENTGDETATQTIEFTVGGASQDSASVNLAGGATETVEFTYTTEAADDGATAEVASDDDTATRTLSVTEPANFAVTINDGASTTDVTAGENAVINATIENTGDETATQTINFTVDGTNEGSVSVNLAGGATETVEFTYTTEAADDDATAAVASDDDTATRTLSVTEPANFAVSINDGASTTDVTAGEDAVINATIENTGDETATQTIEFTVGGASQDSASVNLAGGATETVEFTYTTEAADDGATAEVASDDDSDSTQLTVTEPANFAVAINDQASTTDVTAGEDAVINATIENTGDETATQTIEFTVGGTSQDSVSVNLAGGATETVEFTYTTEAADDGATAEVASDDDNATRTLTVTEPANFAVAINDAASTTDVTAGEDAVINATIENTGDETATQTINFTVNGSDEGSVSVNLNGGATETVEFTYATELADDGATATVASDDDSDSTQLTVTEPANFAVSINDGASTTDVTAGENAVINATIENTGDETATQTINFTVNGSNEGSVSVNLNGGATETVEFTYATELADDGATATVASDDDSDSTQLTVTEPADPANFAVTINDGASTTDVTAGENAVINATIENTGDETGTQTINFTVNGSEEGSVEVTNLAGGATETVEFTYTTELADDGATAEIASDDDSDSTQLTVTEPADPANFAVSDLQPQDTTVTAGENFTVSATITNTGDQTGTQEIQLLTEPANGDELANETVALDAGANTTVTFENVSVETVGEFNHTVASENDSATGSLTVNERPDPATFTVSINDGASTTDVTAGEDAVINATIENTGDEAATQTINFTVGGSDEGSVSVNLAGGATETVEFTYTTEAADDGATAEVASDDDNATRTLTVGDATQPDPEPQGSVTFNNQTVPNGTETVTVASANYTLADGTPGDYVVVAHVVGDEFEGGLSAPVGYSSNLTGEAADITVDLNASEAQGDALDTLTANTTLRAMLHETSSDSAFGPSLGLATDDATITVEDDAQPDPANFTVSDLQPQDATVTVGENFTVSATITNTGDQAGEQDIELLTEPTDGDVLATETVALDAGNSTTVTFENVSVETAGEFNHTVASANDSATGSLTVEAQPDPADPADFTVSGLQPQDATVTVGENFTVSATITNTGDQAGEQDIELLTEPTDGDVLATESNVSLDAGNSTTVTFENVSVETAGEFNHTVASANDSATGSLTVESQPGTANLTGLDIAGQGDTARLTPGAERNVTVTLANTGGEQGTFAVALNIRANGTTVGTETQEVSLASGANTTVTFENVTGDLAADEYNLTVTAAESAVTGSLTVKAAPAAIGGDENATAQDTDGDGTFEDVNGDGNFTVADVFELFNNQDAVPEDDTAAFDFNNDGDFNVLDVQRLLNQQQEES